MLLLLLLSDDGNYAVAEATAFKNPTLFEQTVRRLLSASSIVLPVVNRIWQSLCNSVVTGSSRMELLLLLVVLPFLLSIVTSDLYTAAATALLEWNSLVNALLTLATFFWGQNIIKENDSGEDDDDDVVRWPCTILSHFILLIPTTVTEWPSHCKYNGGIEHWHRCCGWWKSSTTTLFGLVTSRSKWSAYSKLVNMGDASGGGSPSTPPLPAPSNLLLRCPLLLWQHEQPKVWHALLKYAHANRPRRARFWDVLMNWTIMESIRMKLRYDL